MEAGVKPIWVFDGKPPELKAKELDKRKELKQKAEESKEQAIEEGDFEKAKQMAGRSIKITKEMMEDAKNLIRIMGCPVIEAPCEAEAQCAELCQMDLAFGVASEDMDSLTFGAKYLLRGFNSKKEPITQIDLAAMLEGFEMNMDELIDLCIMCGCDYTHSIGNIGPIKAFKLIKEQKNIEGILEAIKKVNEDPDKKQKYIIPENFLYEESRQLFK
jgi:flap endonuclease-1